MARSKSLEEAEREMAAATLVETEIAVEGTPTKGHGEMPFVYNGEGRVSSGSEFSDFADEDASDNENS
jgi:hypothetical protein